MAEIKSSSEPSRYQPKPTPPLLPSTGFIRLKTLLHFVPFSAATVWRKLKDPNDTLPKPVKLGEKITAWRVEDIRHYLDTVGE